MRKLLPVILLLTGLLAAAPIPQSGTETRTFAPGGVLHLEVPVGTVIVRPGGSHQITLHYFLHRSHHVFESSSIEPVDLDFHITGNEATARFTYPDHGDHHTSIDVQVTLPEHTRLRVKLGVGNLTIEPGMAGDKDLEVGVGDIVVHNTGRSEVAHVEAEVGVGSIQGGIWGDGHGFIAHQLEASGPGKDEVRVKAGVGSIHLEP